MQKQFEAFLKRKKIIFKKNYEGSKVPFSHELNLESKSPVYYLFNHKIIIIFETTHFVTQPFIEKEGWKFVKISRKSNFKELMLKLNFV
jgi:hypothetical protein